MLNNSSIDIFPWNENFNTGLSEIDEQHKRLVQLLNTLASHVAFQSDLPALNDIFDQLSAYAVYHFQTEEAIWHQYLSEDLLENQHKATHESFVQTVQALRQEQAVKPMEMVLEEVLAFLARWLAAHILESDRHLAMIVQGRQAGMEIQAAKVYAAEKMSGTTRVLIDIILSIYESLSTNTLHLMRELSQRKRDEEALRKLSLAVEQSPSSIIITDLAGNIEFINQAFLNVTGYDKSEVIGKNPKILKSGKTPQHTYQDMWTALTAGKVWKGEFINKRKNGQEYTEQALISPVQQSDGSISHYLAIKEDISERKQIEARLIESESRLRTIIENEPECIKILAADGSLLQMNPAGLALIEAESFDQVCGAKAIELVAPEHRPAFAELHAAVLAGKPQQLEFEIIGLKGGRRWLETHAVPMKDSDGNVQHLAVSRDIQGRKQAERQLRIAATVFESQEGMMVTDAEANILRVNRAFTETTGYSTDDVFGKNPRLLHSEQQVPEFYEAMWKRISTSGSWEGEVWNRRKNGEIFPAQLSITSVKDQDGKVSHYVGTLSDITQKKAAAEEIERLAFFDPLTGLPNRRMLQDHLKSALAHSARTGQHGALLFIDLDNFKVLNDTLGHDMGDKLLQHVAARLNDCLRESDTVARLGGDEFVVMLQDLSLHPLEAARQTENIGQKIITTIRQPFQLETHHYSTTPSIGATLFQGNQLSIDELLKQADIAMYQAKTAGRNALRFFDPKMQEAIVAKVSLEDELRKALAKQQFKLYYQIQVEGAERLQGAEALIRWPHPERGLISPAEFIPLAEETGLIVPIGQWVLETACAQLKTWQQTPATRELVLSINVSAKQFFQADFSQKVHNAIQQYAINPQLLKLELTESLLIENIEETIAIMDTLGTVGVQFSLDDFGTGYSSLQYLKKLPLNQLKIDQSFVRDIAVDKGDQAIVRTIIAMAASLNLNVIAEGVETDEQRRFLWENGCTTYQGYLFSKPIPIEQLMSQLTVNAD